MATQTTLFAESLSLHSAVIQRRKDFDALFEGFTRMRAVSYVVSPGVVVEWMDKGYQSVEVVVGENLADSYRQDLSQKGPEAVETMAGHVERGALQLWIPAKTLHTKLYILDRPGTTRLVQTSANFTETARQASRQTNYAWYTDLPPENPWVKQVIQDYERHKEGCSLFLGDLVDLFKERQETPRRDLVEIWLRGAVTADVDAEAQKTLQVLSGEALNALPESEEKVFLQKLPEAPAARRQVERALAPLQPVVSGNEIKVNLPLFLKHVRETQGVPLMRADMERGEVRLGIGGRVAVLGARPEDAEGLNRDLEHLETYFQTVDLGQAPDPLSAKTHMMEALLALFSAPFAHEFMKLKRRRFGPIDPRGPRFLYIYGPSQNGKSTFLRFVLKLLAGEIIEPLNGGEFTKRKINGAMAYGTCFPLVFDDVLVSQKMGVFEEVLKSYWEAWWREETVFPQMVISSNTYSLREWAKSRVRKLDFDVHFVPTTAGKETLARLFRAENNLFSRFAPLYLKQVADPATLTEDELYPARLVLRDLYARADRPLPDYFSRESIEKKFDPGRQSWKDLLGRMVKARLEWEKDRVSAHFAEDLQYHEIKEYENALPQLIKFRRRGKSLVIENPADFRRWLEGDAKSPWWRRLLGFTSPKGP
jgi:hypothetical protein